MRGVTRLAKVELAVLETSSEITFVGKKGDD